MARDLCANCLQSFEETALTAVGGRLLCPACQRKALKPAGTSSARIVAAGAEPEAPAGPAPYWGPARVKLFMGVGAGAAVVLMLVVGFVALILSIGNTYTERVDEFFRLAAAGRPAEAYRNCTSATFKNNTSLDDLQKNLADLGASGYARARMSRFQATNDRATWEGTLVFANGRSVAVIVTFEKEAGEWRIKGIKT